MDLKLQTIRKQRKLTQAELAESVGTTMRVVSAWERGETSLPLEDAARIADVLDCTLDELAGREWHPDREYADPKQQALNGYYESMNEAGRDTLVQSAKLMADGNSVRIQKDSPEYPGIQAALGA